MQMRRIESQKTEDFESHHDHAKDPPAEGCKEWCFLLFKSWMNSIRLQKTWRCCPPLREDSWAKD